MVQKIHPRGEIWVPSSLLMWADHLKKIDSSSVHICKSMQEWIFMWQKLKAEISQKIFSCYISSPNKGFKMMNRESLKMKIFWHFTVFTGVIRARRVCMFLVVLTEVCQFSIDSLCSQNTGWILHWQFSSEHQFNVIQGIS